MDFFEDYQWHSSLELGSDIKGKKIVRKLNATKANLGKFIRIANNSNYCIHKATKQLWKIADDGNSIVAVFPEDAILASEEIEK